MGAESETSREPAKYQGTKKLTVVGFDNGNVIVGEAGNQFLSRAVIDRFAQLAAKAEMGNEQSVNDVIADSFRQISSTSLSLFRRFGSFFRCLHELLSPAMPPAHHLH